MESLNEEDRILVITEREAKKRFSNQKNEMEVARSKFALLGDLHNRPCTSCTFNYNSVSVENFHEACHCGLRERREKMLVWVCFYVAYMIV